MLFSLSICGYCQDEPELRDYDGIELPKGTFIQVVSLQEFSTAYCDSNTPLKFVSSNDTFIHETKAIPKGTEFFGYIEKINEPVIGTNSSMVVKITKMRLADGFEIPLRAYLYNGHSTVIGGELTPPTDYIKMPHYQKGVPYGTLQWVPGFYRQMGVHTVIASGAEILIMLTGPAWITHTLTN